MRHIPNGNMRLEDFDFGHALECALHQSPQFDSKRWLYVPDYDCEYRFILGERGKRPIICVGVNPSTAKPDCLDPTLTRVRNLSKQNGYDGYLMLNICAQRATNPDDMEQANLEKLHDENLRAFEYLFSKYPGIKVWAAWGNSIAKRDYLVKYLNDIQRIGRKHGMKWVCMGMTKKGNPRHPLFLPKAARFQFFDIDNYLEKRN